MKFIVCTELMFAVGANGHACIGILVHVSIHTCTCTYIRVQSYIHLHVHVQVMAGSSQSETTNIKTFFASNTNTALLKCLREFDKIAAEGFQRITDQRQHVRATTH